jgi:hypothetical protein
MYALSFIITMKFSGGAGAGGGLMGLGGIASQVSYRLGASLPLFGFLGGPGDLTQPWRLVTAIFLHGGLLHIGFNMWVLMDIGPMVEELYGSARYLFLYVATGVCGYLLSSSVGHFSVGASRAARGDYGKKEHGGAGFAKRADSLADLYRRDGISFRRDGQLRAPGWGGIGLFARPLDAGPDSGGYARAAHGGDFGMGGRDCGCGELWIYGCELFAEFVGHYGGPSFVLEFIRRRVSTYISPSPRKTRQAESLSYWAGCSFRRRATVKQ